MRPVFQWALRVTGFLAGIVGTFIAFLRYRSGEESLAVILIASVLIFLFLLYPQKGDGPALFMVPWLCAVVLAFAVFGYCWPRTSITLGVLSVIFGAVLIKGTTCRPARSVMIFGAMAALSQWAVFAADHLLLGGRIAIFKWAQIEHPLFFRPFEIRPAEREGQKAIYVYDMNFADPSAVAMLWGWSLYPKFVDLDESRPEGVLLNNPRIQEAIR